MIYGSKHELQHADTAFSRSGRCCSSKTNATETAAAAAAAATDASTDTPYDADSLQQLDQQFCGCDISMTRKVAVLEYR